MGFLQLLQLLDYIHSIYVSSAVIWGVSVLTLNIKLNCCVALAVLVLSITAIPCTVCRVCHDVGVIISSLEELKLRSSLSVPGVVELCWVCISPAVESHWFALHHWAGGKRWQRCVFWGIWRKKDVWCRMCGLQFKIWKAADLNLYFTSFGCRQRVEACVQTSTVGHNTNKTPHVCILPITCSLHSSCV